MLDLLELFVAAVLDTDPPPPPAYRPAPFSLFSLPVARKDSRPAGGHDSSDSDYAWRLW